MKILLLGRHGATADEKNVLDLPLSEGGKTESQDMATKNSGLTLQIKYIKVNNKFIYIAI